MANTNNKKPSSASAKKTNTKQKEPSIPQKPAKKQPAKQPAKQTAKQETKQVKFEKEKKGMNKQTVALVLLAVAALLLAMVLIEGESAWLVCHNALFGIFGTCAYLIPLLLIYLAVVYARDKSIGGVAANLIESGMLIILLSAAIHIFSNPAEYFTNTALGPQVSKAWNTAFGTEEGTLLNGGIIGTAIGGFLGRIFGRTGAAITVVILNIVVLCLLTGTTLPAIFAVFGKSAKIVSKATGEKIEKNNQRREERREKKEKEAEEKAAQVQAEPVTEEEKPKTQKGGKNIKPPVIQNSGKKYDTLDEPAMPEVSKTPTITVNGVKLPGTIDGNPGIQANTVPEQPKESLIPTVEKAPFKKSIRPEKPKAEPVKPAAEEKTKTVQKPENEEKSAKVYSFKPGGEVSVKTVDTKYVYPSIECLNKPAVSSSADTMEEMQKNAKKLVDTLDSFHIRAEVVNICKGPSVTRFELVPDAGVRINKITALADDIALRLAAKSVRIEAPIPGKAAIGVEIPNGAGSMVSMREIIDTDIYRTGALKSKLNVALGKDITGNIITADLAKMPHLLVAGTTGSGKSVCMNSMIISILYNASPDEVKLLMIDPKKVEFTVYNGIAHLEVPVVTEPRKAAAALGWAVSEMEKRYGQFSQNGVRDIKGFNKLCETNQNLVKMHHIVIFIDELSDLMMASPKEVEDSICRLAQMARAAGIHLVIATQRPSVDVITGIIKANIPSRIALFVSSAIDSRTILDTSGAEKLLGNGDMLFNPVGSPKPVRVQGCYISDEEVETVVNHVKEHAAGNYNDETMKEIEEKFRASENAGKNHADEDDEADLLDPMFNDAATVVIEAGQASTTMLQKKLKLGYARASRVMDQLEENGIVGPSEGAKPRQVLISKQEWYERLALNENANKQLSFNDMNEASQTPDLMQAEEPEEPEDETEYEIPFENGEEEETEPEDEPEDEPEEIFDFLDDDEEDGENAPYIDVPEPEKMPDDEYDENYDGEFYDDSGDFDYSDEDDDSTAAPVNIDDIFSDDDDYAGSDD